jgi:DNA polymerase-4
VEVTYDRDLTGEQRLDRELVRHAERLGRRLRRAGFAARTVGLKVRFEDFTTFTRSVTLDGPVDGTRELVAAARELLAKVDRTGRGVRLLGLGGSGLVPSDSPRQLHLDQPDDAPLTEAADRVRERFGEQALRVARLVEPPESSPPTQGNERPVSER